MKTKKMFVKIVSMAMALTLSVSLFTGCGNKVSDKDEQGRTKISVGGWPAKEGESLDIANDHKARFEAANTDVVITPDSYAFERKTFYAKAAGKQLPTLYDVGFTEVPEIIASEYSADLTDVLKKRGYDGVFNDDILELVKDEDGKIRAFPISSYLLGTACNTDMMEAAGLMEADGTPKQPKDWYELAEFAVKIKEATGKPGFVFPTSNNCGGWYFTPLAWSFGVDFMDKDENGKWKATFDTPEAVEALQYVKDLKWKYDVLPASTIVDLGEHFKLFATGGAGMCISAGDINGKVYSYEMDPKIIGMMAMPKGPKRHVTLLGGSVYCVAEGSTEDQIDAAVRWIEDSYTYKLNEEFKTNKTDNLKWNLDNGVLVGVKEFSPWSQNAEAQKWYNTLVEENTNGVLNHLKLYNDFVTDCPAEIQAEEPVCAQELYAILDGCIQEVLTNKNADCATLIKKAASDFQANYLDNIIE